MTATGAEQPSRSRDRLLEKLMAVVRPEFRAEVYVPAPNDPVFIADQCAVADCDRTAASLSNGLCCAHGPVPQARLPGDGRSSSPIPARRHCGRRALSGLRRGRLSTARSAVERVVPQAQRLGGTEPAGRTWPAGRPPI